MSASAYYMFLVCLDSSKTSHDDVCVINAKSANNAQARPPNFGVYVMGCRKGCDVGVVDG